jgi:hypothetical protein
MHTLAKNITGTSLIYTKYFILSKFNSCDMQVLITKQMPPPPKDLEIAIVQVECSDQWVLIMFKGYKH